MELGLVTYNLIRSRIRLVHMGAVTHLQTPAAIQQVAPPRKGAGPLPTPRDRLQMCYCTWFTSRT